MEKQLSEKPEQAHVIREYKTERGMVAVYSVPCHYQHVDVQHTRPKGQAMGDGCFRVGEQNNG